MKKDIVKVTSIENLTHNVLKITTEKPVGHNFTPGQATEISINKNGWQDEKRPFTFTCLPGDDYLEFSIKTYPDHKSVTNELLKLKVNDQLILHDVFGTINYQGEGTFIAGGAGVTPFIAILRSLRAENKIGNNKLLFANKTSADIILKDEFSEMLGQNFINILSDEQTGRYASGQITEAFLEANIKDKSKKIYLCGPEPMMDAIEKQLGNIGVDAASIVKEAF
jgi:ferredoxin-NADP reductase